MAGELSIALTADVTNLTAQSALARAEFRDLSGDVRKMAAQMATSSEEMRKSMEPAFKALVGKSIEAEKEVTKLTAEIKEMRAESEKSGGLLSGLSEKVALTGESFEKLTARISVFTKAASAIGEFVLAGLAIEKVADYVGEFAERGEELGKMAAVTGMTTEQLSALQAVAKLTGTPVEALNQLVVKLTRTMQEAATSAESNAGRAFAAMGIQVKDANTGALRPLSVVLDEVAAKLATYKDGVSKSALEQAIFGKTATEMNALLNELGGDGGGLAAITDKFNQLGVTISGSASEASKEYEEHLKTMKLDFDAIANVIMTVVLPAFNSLARAMAPSLDEQIEALKTQIHDLNKAGFLFRAYTAANTSPSDWLKGDVDTVDNLQKRLNELLAQKQRLNDDTAARDKSVFGGEAPKPNSVNAPGFSDKAKDQVAAWKQALAEMQVASGQYVEMSAAQEAAYWQKKLSLVTQGSAEYAQVLELYESKAREASHQTAAAGKKDAAESYRDYVSNLEAKIAADKGNFLAQILLVNQWAAQARATYGEDSTQYAAAVRKKIEIDQQWAAAIEKGDKQRLETARNVAEAQASLDKIGAKPDQQEFKPSIGLVFDDSDLTGKVAAQVAKLKAALDADLAQLQADMQDKVRIGDAVGASDDLKQAAARIQQFADQARETNERAAEAVQQSWEKALSPIGNAFNSQLDAMLRGQEGFGLAAERMAGTVIEDYAKMTIQSGAKWVAQQLIMTSASAAGAAARTAAETAAQVQALAKQATALGFHLTAETAKTGATVTGTAARTAVDTAGHTGLVARLLASIGIHAGSETAKTGATIAGTTARASAEVTAAAASKAARAAINGPSVLADAAKAAAGAYSAVSGIPIVGPVLAPVAAGVAYTAVAAYESLASAEGGWAQVPYDGALSVLHKNEMVLPAALAQRVRDMTAGGMQLPVQARVGGAPSAAPTGGQGTMPAGLPGGSFHYAPNVSITGSGAGSVTRADISAMMDAQFRDWKSYLYNMTRNGTLQHYGR